MDVQLLAAVSSAIPGLARRGTTVLWGGRSGYVVLSDGVVDGRLSLGCARSGRTESAATFHVEIDLTDATARVHVAWWLNERAKTHLLWTADPCGEEVALMLACLGVDMTAEQIDALARLILRVAGMESP